METPDPNLLPVDANNSFLRITRIRQLLVDTETYFTAREQRIKHFLEYIATADTLCMEPVYVATEGYKTVEAKNGDMRNENDGRFYRSWLGSCYNEQGDTIWGDDWKIIVNRLIHQNSSRG